MSEASVCARFLALHRPGDPLLLPNAWDLGSARIFASMGFGALATTSSGFAATLGLQDGDIDRERMLEHAADLAHGVDIPVSADLEGGFGETVDEVAATFSTAARTNLAGASIEDWDGERLRGIEDAAERVRAAAEAAHAVDPQFVVTGRAEGFIRGVPDLADTIRRLQAYQEAGADVLYAPNLTRAEDIRAVVASVDRPVNVLARAAGPTVGELAELGVARISVGGAFAFAAYGAAVEAAVELRDAGTFGFSTLARTGAAAIGGLASR